MSGAPRRLAWQLTIACVALAALCLVLAAAPLFVGNRRHYVSRATARFERELRFRHGELLAAAARDDREELDRLCEALNVDYQGRVSLIAADGSIYADSMSARCRERARPECIPALREERVKMLERAQPLHDTVAIRLPIRLEPLGPMTVRLALPIQPVREEMRRLGQWLLATAVLALMAAVAAAAVIARRIARPIERMTRLAERIAEGDLDGPPPAAGPGVGEIDRLGQALGTMQSSLRQSMSALRRERQQALAIVGAMTDGVLALDMDGRVLFANPAVGELLGGLPTPGSPLAEGVFPEPVRELARRVLEEQVSAETVLGDELQAERLLGVVCTPVPGESGGAVLVLRDITEARRAASLGRELVANASHELRTPLAIVESSADTLLAAGDDLPPDLREFADMISRNCRRMAGLVSETLELSKLESGWGKQPESLDLAELAGRTVEQCRPLAAAKGLELTFSAAAPVPVRGVASQLTSALRNLVENAVHYTPAGGRVEVSVNGDGSHADCLVGDTGPGIPEADRKRIFERFYRGDHAAQLRAEGSGLGLAIVRRVAELHGGSASVASSPGEGSRFLLRLPRPAA